MQIRAAVLLVVAVLAAASAVAASPSYASGADAASDNAYPVRPSTDRYNDESVADERDNAPYTPTSTPCTTATPLPTSTPCTSEGALPTAASNSADVMPDTQQRPVCPAPVTITREHTRTLPAETNTVTATSTVVKPVIKVRTVEKPVEVTVTKRCTITSTVQEYVTKVRTVHDVRTVVREVTRTVDHEVTRTVDHEVTRTVSSGALPTSESEQPSSDYGAVKPYSPPAVSPDSDSAYGPVKAYTPANVSPASDSAYGPAPSYNAGAQAANLSPDTSDYY